MTNEQVLDELNKARKPLRDQLDELNKARQAARELRRHAGRWNTAQADAMRRAAALLERWPCER